MRMVALLLSLWILGTSGSAKNDFERFDGLTHIVKLQAGRDSSNRGRGTGFVVSRDGQLVTNYHVIDGIFKDGKINPRYKIFVLVDGREYLAELVSFDLINDLALLKIPYQFDGAVQIDIRPLKKGQRIYSLGYHSKDFLAINQGTFNDYLKDTPNELMAITAPVNPGMSGGPIIDNSFKVVGVNVVKKRGNEQDAYGINAKKLSAFLNASKVKQQQNLGQILAQQVEKTYSTVIDQVSEATETKKLNSWRLLDLEHILFCGEGESEFNLDEDEDDKNEDKIVAHTRYCGLDILKVPLSALGTQLRFSYSIANLKASKNTRSASYHYVLNERFSFQGVRRIISKDNYRCRVEVIKNRHGIPLKVSVCLQKFKTIPSFIKNKGFFRYDVKAVTLRKDLDDLAVSLRFTGTASVAKKMIQRVLEEIRYEKEEGTEVGQR